MGQYLIMVDKDHTLKQADLGGYEFLGKEKIEVFMGFAIKELLESEGCETVSEFQTKTGKDIYDCIILVSMAQDIDGEDEELFIKRLCRGYDRGVFEP